MYAKEAKIRSFYGEEIMAHANRNRTLSLEHWEKYYNKTEIKLYKRNSLVFDMRPCIK
jgi:hypothetical protein